MAIEPYRFDREVRGRGGHRSGAAHIRRACDRRDPAAVPRDVHDRRPPGDRAGLLPRAPDRDRRGLGSNRCGGLRGRPRTPPPAVGPPDHPLGRVRGVLSFAPAAPPTSPPPLRPREPPPPPPR